jgi:4-hydroxythreonine-4-phosphate dehydrogenase
MKIGALLGDPSGVGPEMMVKLLADIASKGFVKTGITKNDDPVPSILLLAAPAVLDHALKISGVNSLPTRQVASAAEPIAPGEIGLLEVKNIQVEQIVVGQSTTASGSATLNALDIATDAASAGHLHGFCFAPMNKHSLRLGGMTAEDEMRHIQERMGVTHFVCEFNCTQGLWTSRVTSHIPLKDVAHAITAEGIRNAVRIIDRSLRAAGVPSPRIGVCGLNPHAGDGGSIGREEIELIAPAIEAIKPEGIHVSGPFSADTIFVAARKGNFDGIVTLYHDQGQIAMKLMGFESGITVLGGLPIPITTSASGSAFDIAGKGIANIEGLRQALKTCVAMASFSASTY